MPAQPSKAPAQKMPHRPAVMPEAAVKPIAPVCDCVLPVTTGKPSDQSNHLLMPQSPFKRKLVVTDAGIGFPNLYHPVEHVMAVISAVKRKVIFFQFLRQRRQRNRIGSLSKHGQHTDSPGRKTNFLSGCQPLPEQRHQAIQRGKYFFDFHMVFR